MLKKSLDISVIIITHNEEDYISSCISSVVDNLSDSDIKYEIFVIDSDSKDDTINISQSFDINLIKIKDFFSPSLSRYVGFLNSSADSILFLDGDMQLLLSASKIKDIISRLRNGVGGIQGYLVDHDIDGNKNLINKVDKEKSVSFLPGCAFYSRKALESENFNPHLSSNEERDLGYRLRHKGFDLLRLPFPMANHFRKFSLNTFEEYYRRFNSNFFRGSGQIFRVQKNLGPFLKHLFYLKMEFIFLFSLISMFFALFLNFFDYFLIMVISHVFLCLYYLLAYNNPSRYLNKLLISWGIITGFLFHRSHKIEYVNINNSIAK